MRLWSATRDGQRRSAGEKTTWPACPQGHPRRRTQRLSARCPQTGHHVHERLFRERACERVDELAARALVRLRADLARLAPALELRQAPRGSRRASPWCARRRLAPPRPANARVSPTATPQAARSDARRRPGPGVGRSWMPSDSDVSFGSSGRRRRSVTRKLCPCWSCRTSVGGKALRDELDVRRRRHHHPCDGHVRRHADVEVDVLVAGPGELPAELDRVSARREGSAELRAAADLVDALVAHRRLRR